MTDKLREAAPLLPCPFCGDDGDKGTQAVTLMNAERTSFRRVSCRCCGATCPEPNWNHRAARAQQDAQKKRKPLFAEMIAQHPGLAEELAQQDAQAVPPANCRQRLKSEGKPYPRSGCAACGTLSLKQKECDIMLNAAPTPAQQDAQAVPQDLRYTPGHVLVPNQVAWGIVGSSGHARKRAVDALRDLLNAAPTPSAQEEQS